MRVALDPEAGEQSDTILVGFGHGVPRAATDRDDDAAHVVLRYLLYDAFSDLSEFIKAPKYFSDLGEVERSREPGTCLLDNHPKPSPKRDGRPNNLNETKRPSPLQESIS
jgi:hypothetical protein